MSGGPAPERPVAGAPRPEPDRASGGESGGKSGRTPRPPDPLGRRALYWAAGGAPQGSGAGGGPERLPLGKRALFSAAPPDEEAVIPVSENPLTGRGPIVVACSSCGSVTRIGLVDLLFLQFPVGFWFPRGRFDHRMTCPSCRRRVWASVTLRPG